MFFFFKQKTAYEMRISDWSSDVCSSDLAGDAALSVVPRRGADRRRPARPSRLPRLRVGHGPFVLGDAAARRELLDARPRVDQPRPCDVVSWRRPRRPMVRSEEHTSELQLLMRISYAGFCLKKKNTHSNIN